MLFYGDEVGSTNDYSYLDDPGKSYDNRWMHRPLINWKKLQGIDETGSVEQRVFSGTKKLLSIRKALSVLSDFSNLTWLTPHNDHVVGFIRAMGEKKIYCLFNYGRNTAYATWYNFKEHGPAPKKLYDHWREKEYWVGEDNEYLEMEPYAFFVFESVTEEWSG